MRIDRFISAVVVQFGASAIASVSARSFFQSFTSSRGLDEYSDGYQFFGLYVSGLMSLEMDSKKKNDPLIV